MSFIDIDNTAKYIKLP